MIIEKLLRKRRAVSPILAAILLIGLAVAAGALLIAFVMPMVGGTADVSFVSAEAADRNSDGLLDKITVTVINKGAAKDTLAEGTLTTTDFTGESITWTTSGNIEIAAGEEVDLVFQTTDVQDQIEETADLTITLTFDSSDDISITKTDVDMEHAATLTQSDMLLDWQDQKVTRSTTSGSAIYYADTNAEKTSPGGIRFYCAAGSNDIYYYRHNDGSSDDGTSYTSTSGGRTLSDSPETWNIKEKPVISFWIKSNIDIYSDGNTRRLYLYWETWDSNSMTYEDYYQLDNLMEDATSSSNWVRIVIDLGAQQNSNDGDTFGALCFRMLTSGASGSWYIYIDDVSVHDSLA